MEPPWSRCDVYRRTLAEKREASSAYTAYQSQLRRLSFLLRTGLEPGAARLMRLALVRRAFLVVAVQAEHVEQRVAAFGECDAERGEVERRGAHFREQLLLL